TGRCGSLEATGKREGQSTMNGFSACSQNRENPASSRPRGINLSGYLRTESGVGAAVRGYLRALHCLDVPLALKDLSDLNINRAEDRTLTHFDSDHPYDVNL